VPGSARGPRFCGVRRRRSVAGCGVPRRIRGVGDRTSALLELRRVLSEVSLSALHRVALVATLEAVRAAVSIAARRSATSFAWAPSWAPSFQLMSPSCRVVVSCAAASAANSIWASATSGSGVGTKGTVVGASVGTGPTGTSNALWLLRPMRILWTSGFTSGCP
jgi:hypothetical protein